MTSKPSPTLSGAQGLPDPRSSRGWQTVAPATPENPCPKHPTERAESCTCCNIKPRHQARKPNAIQPIWKRLA